MNKLHTPTYRLQALSKITGELKQIIINLQTNAGINENTGLHKTLEGMLKDVRNIGEDLSGLSAHGEAITNNTHKR
ncbi:MAG: hypothetical protein MI974_32005 [Chitinophagales bacterium]|nr:hypothetical protein [Chitinophagales bacterium]